MSRLRCGQPPPTNVARYCDDAELLVVPCDAADPTQRFTFGGDAAGGGAGLLSPNAAVGGVHVRPMPWYEGAGVQLSADRPQRLLFNITAGGTLKTPGSNLAGVPRAGWDWYLVSKE